MIDYSRPSLQNNRDHFILHLGKNDLKSEKNPECIRESIVDLAISLKNEKRDVSVSNIIERTETRLIQKATEVKKNLLEFCKELNLLINRHINKE